MVYSGNPSSVCQVRAYHSELMAAANGKAKDPKISQLRERHGMNLHAEKPDTIAV